MRGEDVDFDMLRIKADIGSIPETADVKFRENIIQSRRRRKNSSKRKVRDMLAQQQINQKAVMQGLEKQRKQRQEDVSKDLPVNTVVPVNITPELVLQPETDVSETDSEVKLESYNRKIRKNQTNGIISD